MQNSQKSSPIAVITLPFPPFPSQKNYIGGILSKIGLETSTKFPQ